MILVILAVAIILTVVGVIILEKTFDFEFLGCCMATAGIISLVVSGIVTIVLVCCVSDLFVIDQKI